MLPRAGYADKASRPVGVLSNGDSGCQSFVNRNTILLIIAFEDAFEFNAGQLVNLQRSDGLTRSYSTANIPEQSNTLEFHIRRLPGGAFSEWLHDEVSVGDSMAVSE